MYKVPEEWKLSDFLELSNDEKLKWLYNGVKNAGGGSDLPEVTLDDNGDVLTVVEGAWAKAAPSGGSSGVFEIYFEVYWDEDANADVVTCNKTLDEISAAKTAGQYITARAMIWQTSPSKIPIGFDVEPEYNFYEFVFDWIDNDPSFNYMYSGRIEYDISTLKWKWTYSQYTVTPYTPSP